MKGNSKTKDKKDHENNPKFTCGACQCDCIRLYEVVIITLVTMGFLVAIVVGFFVVRLVFVCDATTGFLVVVLVAGVRTVVTPGRFVFPGFETVTTSANSSKFPCNDSTILLTNSPILSLSTWSSTNPGVDASYSLIVMPAPKAADIFKFGLRTGGKLLRSFGEV
ncbi:hypothetical protein Bhyg_07841 [Pseudolycoriella hygida]|uniref:Uncharacterized protein n=1 Tax=Pseudolycoriella hygida TaxID=35572 RepID=A0A9Q0S4C2_9DIPT|nr:hypothetical protein Bhyg_07841 [Pseudolycoriella hygida]